MTAATIDTLEFARELQKGGVDEKAAETIAQVIKRNVGDPNSLATKADLAEFKADLAEFKAEVNARFTRIEINQRWQQWLLGGIFALLTALLVLVTHIALRLP